MESNKPLNITIGASSQEEKKKRVINAFKRSTPLNQSEGYCGICKSGYIGNYTNHSCRI